MEKGVTEGGRGRRRSARFFDCGGIEGQKGDFSVEKGMAKGRELEGERNYRWFVRCCVWRVS